MPLLSITLVNFGFMIHVRAMLITLSRQTLMSVGSTDESHPINSMDTRAEHVCLL
jgi:hypothetical protein